MNPRIALMGIIVAAAYTASVGSAAVAQTAPPRPTTHHGPTDPVWAPPGRPKPPTPGTVHLRLNSADVVCGQSIINIVFETETLIGKEWTPTQDDGNVALQVHFIGNGAGTQGLWMTEPTASGGENRLRFNVQSTTLPTWDKLRLIRTDTAIASTAKLVNDDCTP